MMDIKNSIYVEEKEDFPWDEEAMNTFKEIIRNQGIKCCMDDIFLLGFLRARKYDMERSLQLLRNYHNIRQGYPQFFKDHVPSKLEHVLSMGAFHFLPRPDQKGRFISMSEFGKWDASIANITEMVRGMLLCMDFQLNFHRTQVNSIIFIVNGSGLSLSKLLHMSPRLLHSVVTILFKNCYQLRYKEIHYVNLNIMLWALLKFMIPILPEKLRNRIHIHPDMSSLHKFVSSECLPVEYGGTLPNFNPAEDFSIIKANEEFFRRNEEYLNLYEEQTNKT